MFQYNYENKYDLDDPLKGPGDPQESLYYTQRTAGIKYKRKED